MNNKSPISKIPIIETERLLLIKTTMIKLKFLKVRNPKNILRKRIARIICESRLNEDMPMPYNGVIMTRMDDNDTSFFTKSSFITLIFKIKSDNISL